MSAPGIITFRELQDLCRPNLDLPRPRAGTVERWARRQGIRISYDGEGGIFTTLAAVHQALRQAGEPANDAGAPGAAAEPDVRDLI